jgi:hypothetical protein
MEGPANNKGLVPRIFQRAFELFSGDGDIKSFEISLQFFELYNEQLQARARAPARTQWRVRGRQPARCMGQQPASHAHAPVWCAGPAPEVQHRHASPYGACSPCMQPTRPGRQTRAQARPADAGPGAANPIPARPASQDLLNERKPVDVTADPAGGYVCKNGSKVVVTSAQDAEQVYAAGRAKRDTNANQARSHGVVLLTISWVEAKGKRAAGLSLVDLAGSEGLKKGRGSVKEGLKVNLSLTKLALVVKCLAEGTKNVPFRESKLTMILQKSLGGNNMLHVVLALNNNKEQARRRPRPRPPPAPAACACAQQPLPTLLATLATLLSDGLDAKLTLTLPPP